MRRGALGYVAGYFCLSRSVGVGHRHLNILCGVGYAIVRQLNGDSYAVETNADYAYFVDVPTTVDEVNIMFIVSPSAVFPPLWFAGLKAISSSIHQAVFSIRLILMVICWSPVSIPVSVSLCVSSLSLAFSPLSLSLSPDMTFGVDWR